MGGNDAQTLKAFTEAEAFDGPSIIVAYSPCIEHGYDLSGSVKQQKGAVDSAYWPLYRYDPRRIKEGKNPFQLDSKKPTLALRDYLLGENRFSILTKGKDDAAVAAMHHAEKAIADRWAFYEKMAAEQTTAPKVDAAADMPAMVPAGAK